MTCTTKPGQASPTADLILTDAIPSEFSAFQCLLLSPALAVQRTHRRGPRGGPEAHPALGFVHCCPAEKPAAGSGAAGPLPTVALNSCSSLLWN